MICHDCQTVSFLLGYHLAFYDHELRDDSRDWDML